MSRSVHVTSYFILICISLALVTGLHILVNSSLSSQCPVTHPGRIFLDLLWMMLLHNFLSLLISAAVESSSEAAISKQKMTALVLYWKSESDSSLASSIFWGLIQSSCCMAVKPNLLLGNALWRHQNFSLLIGIHHNIKHEKTKPF